MSRRYPPEFRRKVLDLIAAQGGGFGTKRDPTIANRHVAERGKHSLFSFPGGNRCQACVQQLRFRNSWGIGQTAADTRFHAEAGHLKTPTELRFGAFLHSRTYRASSAAVASTTTSTTASSSKRSKRSSCAALRLVACPW
jgi:hypothetical protein